MYSINLVYKLLKKDDGTILNRKEHKRWGLLEKNTLLHLKDIESQIKNSKMWHKVCLGHTDQNNIFNCS